MTLGFRQLANSRWPATPLYCLSINSAELAKTIAGDGVLNVRLKLRGSSKDSAPESFILSDAAPGRDAGRRRCADIKIEYAG
ncbi:virulence factor SrfB [Salmonella sp. WGH-01]|nr:virulence factor SrfB [Salmonella sp. WGH-01]